MATLSDTMNIEKGVPLTPSKSKSRAAELALVGDHLCTSLQNSPGDGALVASPPMQLLLVSLVCFLCPGMYNALSGLGGGGQVNAKDNNKGAIAIYTTFSVVGFFAGTITNRLGIELTLSFGGLGYCVYASALLCYNHTQNSGFLIFAGTLLGACAGLLWCAQGAIMMSCTAEESKGEYISWFWMIFNLGAVIGSLEVTLSHISKPHLPVSLQVKQIPLGQNLHSDASKVNDGTYIGFMILMVIGAILALFLCD